MSHVTLAQGGQWGGCWLALQLWRELQLDTFWQRLPPSRKGTRWDEVLAVLVVYRLLSPGSEWRLHRQWYQRNTETRHAAYALHMTLETLGFGSLVVTFRNCPNNAPLALWVGDPWYPLFPRTTNSQAEIVRLFRDLTREGT